MKKRRDRADELLNHAIALAHCHGYQNVTRDALATAAACSPALISAYFGTMTKLRRAIMSAAIARNDLKIIAQGLAVGDAKARAVTTRVKRAALEGLL